MNQPAQAAPTRYMQGIAVPGSSVRPDEFFQRTRRRRQPEVSRPFAGLGQQDVIELKKTDILAGLVMRLSGSVVVDPKTGAVSTSARWPYDIAKLVRFTANGQSNIISVGGTALKVREFMARGDLTDRGVSRQVNGVAVTSGTLSQSCEDWGVGSRASNIAAGTYDLELEFFVPIAEDQVDLAGAIFAATSSTDLTLTVDWANLADLFTLTNDATATVNAQFSVTAVRYSIPLGTDGQIVVPDLSMFHSLIQSRHVDLSQGTNELRLVGQGAGKTLLRTFSRLWSGNPSAPVAVNADNFGRMAWRYSGNETPDEYLNGAVLRYFNERDYDCDIANVHGFFAHEFASENAFRDAIDLGTTAEWRQVVEVLGGLTSPALEVVAESVFQAGAGA